jgi:predicted NBD/HSP70 family sugar kinase
MRKINTQSFIRATRSTPRKINRQIILNLVREHQPISRADLARQMRVGRGMVTSLINDLLDEGAIYEGAAVDAPRGRRPKMLFVRTHDRLAVAVDLRFSRAYLALTDFGGRPVAIETFDTIVDPTALVAELGRRIRRLTKAHRATGECLGIGLVVPGMVDHDSGRVINAPQLGWRNVDIRDALAKAARLPVQIENAPIACALAHMWLGKTGVHMPRDFVYVTVSDGVGAGVVVNGEVVRGHGNTAGEFGHVPIDPDGPECLCGSRGCLEAFTSNLATLSRYLDHAFSPKEARDLLTASGITIDDVIARSQNGDAKAIAALAQTARYLGIGLSMIINTLNPAQIFLGGEIADAWPQIEPIVRAALSERTLTADAAATPIVPEPASSLPRLRGATALVAAPTYAAPQVA